ncbi:hypothetical protein BB561_002254 [Smittium simulii]|uniref:Peptidase S1 domain-containing protein n=1 Tax=Smittium simulii TaxID=133385 RepID=A0A2T9YR39_9FUNG|nr:hypothetical protein BB561_002254 [Smittium simulii]
MLKISVFAAAMSYLFLADAAYVINKTSTMAEDDSIVTNIINGKNALRSEYPFITQLFFTKDGENFQFACTASLITPKYILTAAHCVNTDKRTPLPTSGFKVMVGSTSLVSGEDIKKLIPVAEVFNFGFLENENNDIALLRLENPIPESMATPVKVYPYKIQDNLPVEVAGFGITTSGASKPSDVLLKTSIKLSSSSNCSQFNEGWKSNSGNMFCSESYNGNDSCQGDSGGPIVALLNKKRVIAGVTSFGTNKDSKSEVVCGENVVAYYTRVAFFLPQIAKIIGVPANSLYEVLK